VTRTLLGALAALSLLAALATPAAAGGKSDPGGFGGVVAGDEPTAAALPTDQFSLN
jgi:hypothetical protein